MKKKKSGDVSGGEVANDDTAKQKQNATRKQQQKAKQKETKKVQPDGEQKQEEQQTDKANIQLRFA